METAHGPEYWKTFQCYLRSHRFRQLPPESPAQAAGLTRSFVNTVARHSVIEVNPLVPEGTWDYFCLDRVRYHGRPLTILFDKTGGRYGRGQGLQVLVDGRRIAGSESLRRVSGTLP